MKSSALSRLFTIMLFDHISLNITLPVYSFIFFDFSSALFAPAVSMATRSFWYGACIAAPRFGRMITVPLLSAWSDQAGRRKVLLINTLGALVLGFAGAIAILSGKIWILLLGSIIGGCFAQSDPTAQAIISDISTPKNRLLYMGYLQCVIAVGAFLGPIIGGFTAKKFFITLNFTLPFWLEVLTALISMAGVLCYFRETLQLKTKPMQQYFWRGLLKLMLDKRVAYISFLLACSQFSWSLYYNFVPPLLKRQLDFSTEQLGIFTALLALWLAVTTLFGLRVMQHFFTAIQIVFQAASMTLTGLLITLAAVYVTNITLAKSLLWIAEIPVAMGVVMTYTAIITLYAEAVEPYAQGKVMGISFLVVSLMWTITGLLGGVLSSLHPVVPIALAPLGICLLLLVAPIFKSSGQL